jgi:hypothetical protein
MISLVAGIVVVAALFVWFGLSNRGDRRHGSCGACPGGCGDCETVTPASPVEVSRGRH